MRHVVVSEWTAVEDLPNMPVLDAPDPEPNEGQVVVAVEAASVSYVNALACTGNYQFKPTLPFTPGGSCAGVVSAVGAGVDASLVGRRVLTGGGGCATHVTAPAAGVIELPDDVDAATAASIPESYGTMHFTYWQRAPLEPGQQVVVLGAGGAIGLAAIDLAKAAGARVIACASSAEKLAAATAVGADATIDYGEPGVDLKTAIREATGGGADVVVDPIGGDLAEPAMRALGFDGRYLVLGFAAGSIPRFPLNLALLNNRAIIGVEFGGWAMRQPSRFNEVTRAVIEMAGDGRIHPLEPTRVSLEDTGRLCHALMTRGIAGRAVVTP